MNSKTLSNGLNALTQAAIAGTQGIAECVLMVCVIAAATVSGRRADSSWSGRGVARLSGGGDHLSFRRIYGEIGGHGAKEEMLVVSAGKGRIALLSSSSPRL